MSILPLKAVPMLDESRYVDLPELPVEGTDLVVLTSPWKNAHTESVAGILITACIRRGNWEAIPVPEFSAMAKKNPMTRLVHSQIMTAMRRLVNRGELTIVEVEDVQYLLPPPEFINVALSSSSEIRII